MDNSVQDLDNRSKEITQIYFEFLDRHLAELISGVSIEMLELQDIANILCISQKHLIKIIQETSGNHPCHFYDLKIIEEAKNMLCQTDHSIAEIARILTYDPSNFSKFFKKFVGQTPGMFRKEEKK